MEDIQHSRMVIFPGSTRCSHLATRRSRHSIEGDKVRCSCEILEELQALLPALSLPERYAAYSWAAETR